MDERLPIMADLESHPESEPTRRRICATVGLMIFSSLISCVVMGVVFMHIDNCTTNGYNINNNSDTTTTTDGFSLDGALIYDESYICNNKTTHSRKTIMKPMQCPMYKFGNWVELPYCNMGPSCGTGKIILHKVNNFMMVTETCSEKCKVNGRQCYKDIDPSAVFYNMNADYCSKIRIRCKSETPITPLIGLVEAYFL